MISNANQKPNEADDEPTFAEPVKDMCDDVREKNMDSSGSNVSSTLISPRELSPTATPINSNNSNNSNNSYSNSNSIKKTPTGSEDKAKKGKRQVARFPSAQFGGMPLNPQTAHPIMFPPVAPFGYYPNAVQWNPAYQSDHIAKKRKGK